MTFITSLEQLQNMVDCDWSLHWVLMALYIIVRDLRRQPHYLEVDLDDDFKLSPASLRHLVWWLGHSPVSVGIAVVQLEVHFLHVGGHVLMKRSMRILFPQLLETCLILVRLEVDRPLMSMSVLLSLFSKVFTNISFKNIQSITGL